MDEPWRQPSIIRHSQRLLQSFSGWTGRSLLDTTGTPIEIARMLFEAPFVLVSHGMEADPIFNYGNRRALELWELSWEQFIQTPSRRTVAPVAQEERDRLLAQARANGYIDNYRGIRISSTGRRFWIEQVLLWTVLDEGQQPCGQAATFPKWEWIVDQ